MEVEGGRALLKVEGGKPVEVEVGGDERRLERVEETPPLREARAG